VAIDPDAITSALSPAERQIVAIARALAHGAARVLVLDEPTSSLAAAEADRVLEATRKLAASGTCVIYVSHHLEEVTRVADRFTVMRAGRTVHVADARGATIAELAELVVGRKIEMAARSSRERGERILEVRGLSGARLPNDASFELYRGEILGIAGLVGSGRTELVRAIFGLDPVRSGQVRVGKLPSDGGATPATRLAQGVGMLSEDRRGEGVALSMSVADNLMLSRLDTVTRAGLVSSDAQDAIARRFIAELAIRASGPRAAASTLSGGNQQKVAIGRLLHHEVDVLLLDEPTRGIDPGSREQIYALAQELATAGKAILWISSQLGELLRVCDRVAVLRRGVLEPPQDAASLDEHGLLAQATGA
jgi:ribose transport system ATP-binding protein